MKKAAAILIPMLACLATQVHAGETDLRVATRAEVYQHPGTSIGAGLSGVYTFLDGELGGNWSYSICNRWITADTKSLYQNLTAASGGHFLDWATVTYDDEKFFFSLGQDAVYFGSYEIYEDDVNNYLDLCSWQWNNMPLYQPGVRAGYYVADGQLLSVDISSSAMAPGRYFEDKLLSYSLMWSGHIGDYIDTRWTVNDFRRFDENLDKRDLWYAALGTKATLGDWTLILESYFPELKSYSPNLSVRRKVGSHFDIIAKGGFYEKNYNSFGGVVVEYYPINNSRNLRFHANATYLDYDNINELSLCCGVTWFWEKVWKR